MLLVFLFVLSNSAFAFATNNNFIFDNTENLVDETLDTISDNNKKIIQGKFININLSNPLAVSSPLYINNILLVNKDYALPSTFNPGNNKEMLQAFNKMKEAAKKDNISIDIGSSFRSYSYQDNLYKSYVKSVGEKNADKFSAKPGHSEHQTGLTVDIVGSNPTEAINSKFDNSKEAKWLLLNAHKFGFILRYPKGKEHITGYKYESWHYRYIGVSHSKYFYDNTLSLEEYLNLA
ncbi:M15 family metallopeptidase [Clostridium sp.]|uniref:M15 family metallopeptidase n=1 Tax=Clostridium sp. TaxID=1506 RepID=UPI003F6769CE